MEAKELRDLKVEELGSRVQQWREELFRARFKARTSETKDTSVLRKLRRDIARALTIMKEKQAPASTAAPAQAAAPVDQPVAAEPKAKKAKSAGKAKTKGSNS